MTKPSATNTYTVTDATIAAGALTIKIFTELSGLTVPSFNSITFSAPIVERRDVLTGEIELPNASFRFVEDYSTYTEGFWFKVLTYGLVEVECWLDEGAGDKFLFRGRVVPETIVFDEYSKSGTGFVRGGVFDCAHFLTSLIYVKITDLITNVNANHRTTVTDATNAMFVGAGHDEYFVNICAMMAAMLDEIDAPGSDTYGGDEVDAGGSQDCTFNTGAAWVDVSEVYVYVGNDVDTNVGYFDSANDFAWQHVYSNCWELLGALCKAFLTYPRLTWASGTSEFNIELMSIGRCGDTATTLDTPISSEFIKQAYPKLVGAEYQHRNETDAASKDYWHVDQQGAFNNADIGKPADVSVVQQLYMDTGETAFVVGTAAWDHGWWVSGGFCGNFSDARFYDYDAAAESSAQNYVVGFFEGKFMQDKTAFRRTYPSLKASNVLGTSFEQIYVGQRTQITYDEAGSTTTKTFSAVEIERDVIANRMTVLWYEV